MNDLLISGARIVNEEAEFEADVLINRGRIERIDTSIDARARARIDATGKLLIPGMIDDQVHFREPGLTHKADIATESKAAVAGGITSYLEMPNTSPPTATIELLEQKYALAGTKSWANYGFYLGATNDNLDEVERLDPRRYPGVKVFMGASTGNMLVDDPRTLEGIFAGAPVPVATHCEDTPLIEANLREARQRYGAAIPPAAHPEIRSEEACWLSSSLAVELARRNGTRLHVLHLTTARELALFEPGPVATKQITCEVCVHHLHFDDADYARLGNRIKCNPAIKTAADRGALLAALVDERIDIIATDHAPHTMAEKDCGYEQAAAGLPLVQDALGCLLEHYHQGRLSLATIVEKTSHNVARRFRIVERGFIREGYWADLALIDLEAPRVITRDRVLSKCGWSPFEGERFASQVVATVVSGHVCYRNGEFDPARRGARLEFQS